MAKAKTDIVVMGERSFVREYWKQVDLHSHTLRGVDCHGVSNPSSYTHTEFKNAIKSYGTQLQAVTNHNTLHIEDHVKHAIICDLCHIGYIPGVELDIKLKGKDKPFQCVFLLGPKTDICLFSDSLNKMTETKRKTANVYFDEEEISKLFSNTHFIYVVHGVKAKGLAESQATAEEDKENISWVCKAIQNALAEPVLFENTQPQRSLVLENRFREFTNREDIIELIRQQVTTSDYTFNGDEDRKKRWLLREKFAICAEPSYAGLELSIRHYKTRFQKVSEIVEPVTFIEAITFDKRIDKKFSVGGRIEFSPYFNVIIGNSGSGKTLLLNEIYRAVTGTNLKSATSKSETKTTNGKNVSIYEGYIGKQKLFSLDHYNDEKPVVYEIDKIYDRMLKAGNPALVAELFNVSIPEESRFVLSDYKKRVLLFETLVKSLMSLEKEGSLSLESILLNSLFIKNNPVSPQPLSLPREIFDGSKLESYKNKVIVIDALINETRQIDEWIDKVKGILGVENETVKSFERSKQDIVAALNHEKNHLENGARAMTIDRLITSHYNDSIDKMGAQIGNKHNEVDRAKAVIKSQIIKMKNSIVGALKAEREKDRMSLAFPFDEISGRAIVSQTNKYARLTVDYTKEDRRLEKSTISDHRLFVTTNILSRIKSSLENRTYKLELSDDVKRVATLLAQHDLSFSSLIKEEIPYTTELSDEGTWKKVTDMNPGNLAKRYMEYYFRDALEKYRPNVVFIDQPENDVDKTFISDVLADFISKHKTSIQFFITSHEPILGVNSDPNLLIECRRSNTAIEYKAKYLESQEDDAGGESGVRLVSRILDGGKDNVIKRNQLYGGSVDG